jgi:tetratricopeptide (TPR) repeat protein/mono/diheme cytochrome c family protein
VYPRRVKSAGFALLVLLAGVRLQAETVSFSKNIAPLVFERCAACHQPGGAGPFSLLTYASARQHAGQIAALTKSRIMPPWRAESEYGGFIGQHPLTDAEIDLLQQWVAQGAAEGDPRELPPVPKLAQGWQLGNPDLVVTLPEPYTLQADGTDVFRIFVIPLLVGKLRYVTGLEFHPGNAQVVHHANIRIDRTRTSRRLDEEDPAPGYDGLIARTAVFPDGHFLGWTPGQVAPLLPKGLAWRLEPDTDLVVQIHMQPSGKPEAVQPSIGLFFGNDPPERTPMMMRLGRQNIDIPAGEKNYTITDSFVLPVDVEVQAVQPHAHYRAHEVSGTATLPDGATKTLIHIRNWDFRWQHVYRYVTPFSLPKGTRLAMRYTYDNSADNLGNPTQPPQRVFYGQRSKDEMGDLWIQLLTKDSHDLDTLDRQLRPKAITEDVVGYLRLLESEPQSVALHDDLAGMYLELGRPDAAVVQFEASAKLKPELAATHFNLGLALTLAGKLDEAIGQYRKALDIEPDYALAHNNLGGILLQRGNADEALAHFREAVRIDPTNAAALNNLGAACRDRGEEAEAIDYFRRGVLASPNWATAIADLAWMLATASNDRLRQADLAVRLAERASDLTGHHDPWALDVLAAAYASAGDFDRAVATAREALQLAPAGTFAAEIRARQELYSQHRPYRRATPQQ